MRKIMFVMGACLMLIGVPIPCAFAQTVSAYMCLSPESNAGVAKFILEKTGITLVQSFMSCGEVEAKVKAETPNYNVDVVVSASPLAFLAKKNKWIVPYDSPGWKGISTAFLDPERNIYTVGTYSYVLMGNKDKLAQKGYAMPKSWKDLLDPKWKGEIVMPSPLTSGTANLMVFSFLSIYGDQGGWKYLEALDKNVHHYTRSGAAPQDLVSRGEFMLGIATDDGLKSRIDQGYPLIWSIPEEGVGFDGVFAFILKGTKQLEASKKVLDAMGSEEMSQLMSKYGYMTPRPAENPLYGKAIPKYVKVDLGWAAENKPRINDLWKSKFRLAQ